LPPFGAAFLFLEFFEREGLLFSVYSKSARKANGSRLPGEKEGGVGDKKFFQRIDFPVPLC